MGYGREIPGRATGATVNNLTVNDRVRLPDGRIAKVIAVPVFTSRYVTVLVEDEPGEGRAYQVDANELVKI